MSFFYFILGPLLLRTFFTHNFFPLKLRVAKNNFVRDYDNNANDNIGPSPDSSLSWGLSFHDKFYEPNRDTNSKIMRHI